jgi:hypothetical protein
MTLSGCTVARSSLITERFQKVARNNVEKVEELFTGIGVTCYDHTTKDTVAGVKGLIIDRGQKKIFLCTTAETTR